GAALARPVPVAVSDGAASAPPSGTWAAARAPLSPPSPPPPPPPSPQPAATRPATAAATTARDRLVVAMVGWMPAGATGFPLVAEVTGVASCLWPIRWEDGPMIIDGFVQQLPDIDPT